MTAGVPRNLFLLDDWAGFGLQKTGRMLWIHCWLQGHQASYLDCHSRAYALWHQQRTENNLLKKLSTGCRLVRGVKTGKCRDSRYAAYCFYFSLYLMR